MWRLAAALAAAALVSARLGGSGPGRNAGRCHPPAEGGDRRRAPGDRAARKDPPHLRAARDRIYRSADRVNGVYDFLSGVSDAAAGQDALGGAQGGRLRRRAPAARCTTGRVRRAFRARSSSSNGRCCGSGRGFPSWRTRNLRLLWPVLGRQGQRSRRDHRLDARAGLHLLPRRPREFPLLVWAGLGDRRRTPGALGLVLRRVLGSRGDALDDVQLNGRYDIRHAPSCGTATPKGFRCKTKDGAEPEARARHPPRHDVAVPEPACPAPLLRHPEAPDRALRGATGRGPADSLGVEPVRRK